MRCSLAMGRKEWLLLYNEAVCSHSGRVRFTQAHERSTTSCTGNSGAVPRSDADMLNWSTTRTLKDKPTCSLRTR